METCGPKGRDCIERNPIRSFNCSTTCEGIYADVQWVEKIIEEDIKDKKAEVIETVEEVSPMLLKRLANLEKEVKFLKNSFGENGEELDKEKYKMMIAEYRKFKTKNVKHFRFNAAENSSAFGKF